MARACARLYQTLGEVTSGYYFGSARNSISCRVVSKSGSSAEISIAAPHHHGDDVEREASQGDLGNCHSETPVNYLHAGNDSNRPPDQSAAEVDKLAKMQQ